MAIYILAGGADLSHPAYMQNLARIVFAKVTKPRILGVWFAGSDDRADKRFPEFHKNIREYFPDGTIYEMAEKERFIEQIRSNDVIYIHGGSTSELIPALHQYPKIEHEFEGKIVIGSSAGAGYLASHYWSPSKNEVGSGSGIIDAAIVAHYGSSGFSDFSFKEKDWSKAVELVRAVSGRDEITLLPEGTFIVIEKQLTSEEA